MATCIGVLEADEPLTKRPRYYLDKATVKLLVMKKLVQYVGPRLVRKIKSVIKGFTDGPLGTGNALPFSAPTDASKKFHYEMPHAGDRGMRRHGIFRRGCGLHTRVIRVSSRSCIVLPAASVIVANFVVANVIPSQA